MSSFHPVLKSEDQEVRPWVTDVHVQSRPISELAMPRFAQFLSSESGMPRKKIYITIDNFKHDSERM